MRISTGKYKGRQIKAPAGIRPTQDKVRKALFDILGDIEGLSFLELFAGSGAVGFEAVSRGVRELTWVESSRDCLLEIKKNIELLKVRACELLPKDTDTAIKMLHENGRSFDIIFLDPPYYKGKASRRYSFKRAGAHSGSMGGNEDEPLTKKTLQTLSVYDILNKNGFIIVQHFKKDNLPDALGDLTLFRQSRYGDTVLSFYRKLLQQGLRDTA